jgi:GntR family transcriptional repressor for pyruvate dehydrogenase complex
MKRIIKNDHLYEKVLDVLIEYYEDGLISLNEKLPTERQLSELLSVSRNTIRDAYRYLEIKGFIITKAGGGRILVRSLDKNLYNLDVYTTLREREIKDLLEIREILELGLVDFIIERATTEEFLAIKKEIEKNSNEFDGEFDFHMELAKLSKNEAAVQYYKLNNDVIEFIKSKNYDDNSYNYYKVQQEHLEIIDSFLNKNQKETKNKIKNHLGNIYQRYTRGENNEH